MTLRGLIALARTSLEETTNIDMASIGAANQGIPDVIAASGAVDLGTARLIASAAAILGLLWFCLKDAEFRGSKRTSLPASSSACASPPGGSSPA